ncbi:MAG: M4 family metallopeptidase [Bauldia sp.]
MARLCTCLNCIVPPHLLNKLLESSDREVRDAALGTLLATARMRGERQALGPTAFSFSSPTGGRRTIFDCQGSMVLGNARVVRSDSAPPVPDDAVNEAYDGLTATREFYSSVFQRDSIDGNGMRLDAYVHYGTAHNNAYWNGRQMLFGDGDGVVFTGFTKSLDVIGHELTHGVTEYSAGLEYHNQPGALNESISDVFGSLIKQKVLNQTAEEADWLIGTEIFTPGIEADALRSMKAPGTAYNNPMFGRDPQPDHMNRFAQLPDTERGDWGGVHINSGIPNKAFYLVATAIGGFAWEAAGHIWYEALCASSPTTEFQDFAETTCAKAEHLYGGGSVELDAVRTAWRDVGIRVSGASAKAPPAGRSSRGDEEIGGLAKRIDALTLQVKGLAKEVSALKARK